MMFFISFKHNPKRNKWDLERMIASLIFQQIKMLIIALSTVTPLANIRVFGRTRKNVLKVTAFSLQPVLSLALPPRGRLLWTWLLRRTLAPVSNKSSRKNSAQNKDALAEEPPGCFMVVFRCYGLTVFTTVDHFPVSSAAIPFHSYLQVEKNVFSIPVSSVADSLHSWRKGKPRPGGERGSHREQSERGYWSWISVN